ncbi:MAG: response regulator [Lachnospiraceae bacterium]|nr:response regulator [Lachnospiraceae bacterium]
MISFVINDTGVGIEKDYLPRLFEPFSKEEEGTSNRYGSTGLGMAITKNIVDMMGGEIEVTSEKGRGSEFYVTIPLQVCQSGQDDTLEADFSNITALIVDDDITACEHGAVVLSRVGIRADHALSGRDALTMMEKQRSLKMPYRIVLVDWKMPEMDGVELTRHIRRRQGDEDTTIILTTYNWDDIMEEALDAGVDAFLAKPLFAGNIRQKITAILSEKKERKAAQTISLAGKRVMLAEVWDSSGSP